jgi:hypothetical protein
VLLLVTGVMQRPHSRDMLSQPQTR